MPIRINCPDCQTVCNVPDTARGKKVRCPHCQSVFPVEPASQIQARKAAPAKQAAEVEAEEELLPPRSDRALRRRIKSDSLIPPPKRKPGEKPPLRTPQKSWVEREMKAGIIWLAVMGGAAVLILLIGAIFTFFVFK